MNDGMFASHQSACILHVPDKVQQQQPHAPQGVQVCAVESECKCMLSRNASACHRGILVCSVCHCHAMNHVPLLPCSSKGAGLQQHDKSECGGLDFPPHVSEM